MSWCWGYLVDWGWGSNLCHLLWWIYKSFISKEWIGSLTALDVAKLTKIAYFCCLRGKIDFKNLHVCCLSKLICGCHTLILGVHWPLTAPYFYHWLSIPFDTRSTVRSEITSWAPNDYELYTFRLSDTILNLHIPTQNKLIYTNYKNLTNSCAFLGKVMM